MENLIISVPNMQSTHCQTRVNDVVRQIEGAQVQQMNAGKVTVSFASERVKEEIFSAIKNAGYRVEDERGKNASDCSTGCCG